MTDSGLSLSEAFNQVIPSTGELFSNVIILEIENSTDDLIEHAVLFSGRWDKSLDYRCLWPAVYFNRIQDYFSQVKYKIGRIALSCPTFGAQVFEWLYAGGSKLMPQEVEPEKRFGFSSVDCDIELDQHTHLTIKCLLPRTKLLIILFLKHL